jgi:NhaP-type Na+/H+ or K+/H+ antiporter
VATRIGGAAVNTTQQVGGSIGIALLSTLAASAVTGYLKTRDATDPTVLAQVTLHSYAVAYWIAAAIFTGGALLVAALYRAGISADPIATDHATIHDELSSTSQSGVMPRR